MNHDAQTVPGLAPHWTMIDRRGAFVLASGAVLAAGAAHGRLGNPLDRLAMTTVCLRDRIPVGHGATPRRVMPLDQVFGFVRHTFGLTRVELWSLQFPDTSDTYCQALRTAAHRAGSHICNIQLDGAYDLSSRDGETRTRAIAFAMDWIRRAAIVGAPGIRINTDRGADHFELATLVPIYRQLGDYGQSLGVRVLIENHLGHSRSIVAIVALLTQIDHPNVRAIADWGNSPAPDFAQRLADLALLAPWLDLVSAKGLHFTPAGDHAEYPIAPIVLATERAGYRGLYSIELYTDRDPPDPVSGVKAMIRAITAVPLAPGSAPGSAVPR